MGLAAAAATAFGLFLVVYGLLAAPARRAATSTPLDERIRYYGMPAAQVDAEELAGSLYDRMVRPQFDRLAAMVARWTPTEHADRLSRDLALAGQPLGLDATDFVVARVAVAVVGGCAGLAIGFVFGTPGLGVVAALLIGAMGWLALDVWLRSAVRGRRQQVRDALPDVIDFMVVAMEAGMTFDSALARVVEKFQSPLTADFARALAEVDLGRPRQEALEAFAQRSGIDELSTFVQTVVSAGQMGVPLVESLRIQAEQLRWRRRDRARLQGAQAPIKMTIPLVVFIFPTIWIVLLGPSLLTIMSHGI